MRTKTRLRTIVWALFVIMMLVSAACGSYRSGAPEGFVGQWTCEAYASDGQTDTSFYAMNVEEGGHFSIYDAAAGNPGIAGLMGNDSGSTIECKFDMDDFDVPFCWTITSSRATLSYELDGDTLKLGHNGVWMTFHRAVDEGEDWLIPEPLDDLVSYELPSGFILDMTYPYGGEEGRPVVEKAYTSESKGYFSVGIFSYQGWDCLGDINQTVDLDGYVDSLDRLREITIDGETGYFGTHESDDMPDMVAVAYVPHDAYVFEFRLTNYDAQVTEEQVDMFEDIVRSARFKD